MAILWIRRISSKEEQVYFDEPVNEMIPRPSREVTISWYRLRGHKTGARTYRAERVADREVERHRPNELDRVMPA